MANRWIPWLAVVLAAIPAQGQGPPARASASPVADLTDHDRALGQRLFEAHCARCHSVGGTGGEGPSLTRPELRYAADDRDLFSLIQGGIPGGEMPGIWFLSSSEIWRLVGYVRSLGRTQVEALPGDVDRGQAIFVVQSCDNCHIVAGRGRSFGPELTDIGARRAADFLRRQLLDNRRAVPEEFLMMRVRTSEGDVVEGIRMNEDAFTVQLYDVNGRFYSWRKPDLAELRKLPRKTLMPGYGTRLSAEEIDDLVAYLASLRGREE